MVEELIPSRFWRAPIDSNVELQVDGSMWSGQHRSWQRVGLFREGAANEAAQQQSSGSRDTFHARTSLTTSPEGSANRIGLATFETFCLRGSRPIATQIVAIKSGTPTGRSSTVIPLALVRPTVCPPRMPPPPKTMLHATG